ncbi:MAG TPA: efflux RND transporter periplasmic adaptor subunit [Pyrinomonadaceae bacterium]|nr:efflux RND transporter periplasmic adaptor subunit [Pyrinomonadaceae bacterium]
MSTLTADEHGAKGRATESTPERTPEQSADVHADGKQAIRQETVTIIDRWRGMPRRNRVLIVGGVAALALALLLYALFLRAPAKKEMAEEPAPASPTGTVKFLMEQQWLIRMKLAEVEEHTVARQITSTGRVVPAANSQALVAPPVSGILSGRSLPRVGQYVAQGQTIAVIQQVATGAEQAQVRAAAASVQAQNAQINVENARLEADRRTAAGEVDTARTRLDLAQKEMDRAQRLFERKAYSQRQLQAAQADLETARAAYNAAVKRREALAAARSTAPASVNVGSANASYTVRAPLGGYVTKVNKSLGEQVAPGEAILEISNLDTVWIEAPIFERDLNRLGGNVTATFTTAAYPDQEFKGVVLDVGAVIDEKTRAATVIFQVPNSGRALRIGMQANVRLDAGESVTAMMIPKEAVLDNEGKKIVYVLLSGEEFQRREVTLGDEYGPHVAILSGLNVGERVVTQGAYQIRLQEMRPADAGAHSHET